MSQSAKDRAERTEAYLNRLLERSRRTDQHGTTFTIEELTYGLSEDKAKMVREAFERPRPTLVPKMKM